MLTFYLQQILFYPNSGGVEGCVSLYLSAEPTPEERAAANSSLSRSATAQPLSSSSKDSSSSETTPDSSRRKSHSPEQWTREGSYRFTFEVRTLDRSLIKSMEASDYRFSSNFSNWGYAHFSSRNLAYYNNPKSRADDAFIIIVQILEPATLPNSTSLTQPNKTMIPYELVMAYAALFNSPTHSDVVFVVAPRRPGARPKKLFAIKKILAMRSEYFASMFEGGWSESGDGDDPGGSIDWEAFEDEEADNSEDAFSDTGDFSEDEDEEAEEMFASSPTTTHNASASGYDTPPRHGHDEAETTPFSSPQPIPDALAFSPARQAPPSPSNTDKRSQHSHRRRGSSNIRHSVVHITDASFSTFRGCLYWLYTDFIQFAELSSSFHVSAGRKEDRRAWTLEQARVQRSSGGWNNDGNAAALVPLVKHSAGYGPDEDGRLWLSNAKQIYKLADSKFPMSHQAL